MARPPRVSAFRALFFRFTISVFLFFRFDFSGVSLFSGTQREVLFLVSRSLAGGLPPSEKVKSRRRGRTGALSLVRSTSERRRLRKLRLPLFFGKNALFFWFDLLRVSSALFAFLRVSCSGFSGFASFGHGRRIASNRRCPSRQTFNLYTHFC